MMPFSGFKNRVLILCSCVLTVALVMVGGFYYFSRSSSHHEFFSEVGATVISASDMEYVKGEYSSFEGEEVKQFEATANGIVLVLDGELVSINGKDGAVQWRYARSGELKVVRSSPSGNFIHAVFESSVWPWSDMVHVGLSSYDGEPQYEHPSSSFYESFQNSDFYFSEHVMAEYDPYDESSFIKFYDLDSGAIEWSLDVESLCLSGRLSDNGNIDIYPAPLSFIVSLSCSWGDGGENQVMVQLSAQEKKEYWRGEWRVDDHQDSERPEVYYVSGASVPRSEDDLLELALSSGESELEYAFLVDSTRADSGAGYWSPRMFDFDVIRNEFPVPLEDEKSRPDVVIIGMPVELNIQVALQASRILMEMPSSLVEEDDFSLLELRGPDGAVDAVSYRNWDESALPAVESTFIREMMAALEASEIPAD